MRSKENDLEDYKKFLKAIIEYSEGDSWLFWNRLALEKLLTYDVLAEDKDFMRLLQTATKIEDKEVLRMVEDVLLGNDFIDILLGHMEERTGHRHRFSVMRLKSSVSQLFRDISQGMIWSGTWTA